VGALAAELSRVRGAGTAIVGIAEKLPEKRFCMRMNAAEMNLFTLSL